VRIEGKLLNTGGEFIASGPCEVHAGRGEVTMWPSWQLHMLEREPGELSLELADGRVMRISDKHLTFKLQGPSEQRITVYRLRLLPVVPDHLSAGYAPEPAGAEASPLVAPTEPAPAEEKTEARDRLRLI
jgi:hypothetical protein